MSALLTPGGAPLCVNPGAAVQMGTPSFLTTPAVHFGNNNHNLQHFPPHQFVAMATLGTPGSNVPSLTATVANGNQNGNKDSRWLTLEVCREYTRNKCTRSDAECKYAHPPGHVEVQNGRVTACFDSIKGRCNREKPPCKYLHPPQHLKEQLLVNGRNNLALKNAALMGHLATIHHQALLNGGGLVASLQPSNVPNILYHQSAVLGGGGMGQGGGITPHPPAPPPPPFLISGAGHQTAPAGFLTPNGSILAANNNTNNPQPSTILFCPSAVVPNSNKNKQNQLMVNNAQEQQQQQHQLFMNLNGGGLIQQGPSHSGQVVGPIAPWMTAGAGGGGELLIAADGTPIAYITTGVTPPASAAHLTAGPFMFVPPPSNHVSSSSTNQHASADNTAAGHLFMMVSVPNDNEITPPYNACSTNFTSGHTPEMITLNNHNTSSVTTNLLFNGQHPEATIKTPIFQQGVSTASELCPRKTKLLNFNSNNNNPLKVYSELKNNNNNAQNYPQMAQPFLLPAAEQQNNTTNNFNQNDFYPSNGTFLVAFTNDENVSNGPFLHNNNNDCNTTTFKTYDNNNGLYENGPQSSVFLDDNSNFNDEELQNETEYTQQKATDCVKSVELKLSLSSPHEEFNTLLSTNNIFNNCDTNTNISTTPYNSEANLHHSGNSIKNCGEILMNGTTKKITFSSANNNNKKHKILNSNYVFNSNNEEEFINGTTQIITGTSLKYAATHNKCSGHQNGVFDKNNMNFIPPKNCDYKYNSTMPPGFMKSNSVNYLSNKNNKNEQFFVTASKGEQPPCIQNIVDFPPLNTIVTSDTANSKEQTLNNSNRKIIDHSSLVEKCNTKQQDNVVDNDKNNSYNLLSLGSNVTQSQKKLLLQNNNNTESSENGDHENMSKSNIECESSNTHSADHPEKLLCLLDMSHKKFNTTNASTVPPLTNISSPSKNFESSAINTVITTHVSISFSSNNQFSGKNDHQFSLCDNFSNNPAYGNNACMPPTLHPNIVSNTPLFISKNINSLKRESEEDSIIKAAFKDSKKAKLSTTQKPNTLMIRKNAAALFSTNVIEEETFLKRRPPVMEKQPSPSVSVQGPLEHSYYPQRYQTSNNISNNANIPMYMNTPNGQSYMILPLLNSNNPNIVYQNHHFENQRNVVQQQYFSNSTACMGQGLSSYNRNIGALNNGKSDINDAVRLNTNLAYYASGGVCFNLAATASMPVPPQNQNNLSLPHQSPMYRIDQQKMQYNNNININKNPIPVILSGSTNEQMMTYMSNGNGLITHMITPGMINAFQP